MVSKDIIVVAVLWYESLSGKCIDDTGAYMLHFVMAVMTEGYVARGAEQPNMK